MKSKFVNGFLFLLFFGACNNEKDQGNTIAASENDVDAARNFIRSALDGNYRKARSFIVSDSTNNQYIDVAERSYQSRMNAEDKRGYRESSITIHSVKELNDSTSIVQYSNTYKKQGDSLKVVRVNNQWLVDLKYSFPETRADSTHDQ